ncbi:MAG: hypothetical protein Q8N05_13675 [Bacteroidota bacterium]|nr:hypothetical protein [Bacteroidota bacterium]
MTGKKIDRLINILYSLSAIAVLLGAIFKLQHYPHGTDLLSGGFIAGALIKLGTLIRSDKKSNQKA